MAQKNKLGSLPVIVLVILCLVLVFLVILFPKFKGSIKSRAGDQIVKTVTLTIDQTKDIANEDDSSFAFPTITSWFGNGGSTTKSYLGMRFSGQSIPQGARIVSAKVEFMPDKTQWINVNSQFFAEKSIDPAQFSTSSRPSTRSLTTASRNFSDNVKWLTEQWYSYEVTGAVQEVVNIGSPNAISIIVKGIGKQYGRKYIWGNPLSGKSPKLTITYIYTPPEPSLPPEELRVLEVRYFPKGEQDVIYHPDVLSTQLQNLLSEASRFQGYKNSLSPAFLKVNVVEVINRFKARPNVDNNWGTTYQMILEEDNLCQKIKDQDIDQIWLWVDPRPDYDPNPGVEYAISSNHFQNGVQFATVATPAFCSGEKSFVIMGFDNTRTADLALHSFGHYLEGLLGNLQTVELFWYRFGGNTAVGYPLSERCGNVHFPPNGLVDYDYSNQTTVSTSCEDWNPDVTGIKTAYNCSRWGCNQEGYLKWWMQNMPNRGNTLTYKGRIIPNWLDFVVDLDQKITKYETDAAFFMNTSFLEANP